MFQAIQPRTIRWRYLPDFAVRGGQCHVALTAANGNLLAHGMAVGDVDGAPFAACFIVETDAQWRTRSVTVEAIDGRGFAIASDGEGAWTGQDGRRISLLDGCIDVDLQATPYTNTLPIRRLDLTPARGAVELDMAYVDFDTFEISRLAQRYTCLEAGRRYLYENADGSFAAEVTVDDEGLVVEYPPLFERLDR